MDRPTSSAVIKIGDRSCLNATLRIVYLVLKVIYMAFVFYWGLYLVP